MNDLIAGLKAAGEPTRLRLLALCANGELSVTELTQILAQSQPRVSRHLKLMVEAGLLTRLREGSMVFYRIADQHPTASLARKLVELLPEKDPGLQRDMARFEKIRQKRAQIADTYFQENAAQWDKIRALHVPEAEVENRLLAIVGKERIPSFLDIGTGTGRLLELFAPQVDQGLGIDLSSEMLTIARTQLEKHNLKHLQVRKSDMYTMPIDDQTIDLATLHLVLHYSQEPGAVIAEASRTLVTGGRLLIVDFASHEEEQLRIEHKHVRLGFHDDEIAKLMQQNQLALSNTETLVGNPLTVKIWLGTRLAS